MHMNSVEGRDTLLDYAFVNWSVDSKLFWLRIDSNLRSDERVQSHAVLALYAIVN